jgi:hypothetical protein
VTQNRLSWQAGSGVFGFRSVERRPKLAMEDQEPTELALWLELEA